MSGVEYNSNSGHKLTAKDFATEPVQLRNDQMSAVNALFQIVAGVVVDQNKDAAEKYKAEAAAREAGQKP